jgi:hypothetical protein
VVASKKKHAKAKLLIMNFIGLALDDDTQDKKKKPKKIQEPKDPKKTTV